jgi:hypothetical protein
MAPWALEAEEEMSKLPIGALALALLMCFTVTAPAVRAALADGTPATADGSSPPMIEGGPSGGSPNGWDGWGWTANLSEEQQKMLAEGFFFLAGLLMYFVD